MKSQSVKSSELGLNCWSPLRFFDRCWACHRYEKCTYPEKVFSEEFERLRDAYREARNRLIEFTGGRVSFDEEGRI